MSNSLINNIFSQKSLVFLKMTPINSLIYFVGVGITRSPFPIHSISPNPNRGTFHRGIPDLTLSLGLELYVNCRIIYNNVSLIYLWYILIKHLRKFFILTILFWYARIWYWEFVTIYFNTFYRIAVLLYNLWLWKNIGFVSSVVLLNILLRINRTSP